MYDVHVHLQVNSSGNRGKGVQNKPKPEQNDVGFSFTRKTKVLYPTSYVFLNLFHMSK